MRSNSSIRAEGPRILLDPALRETLANGAGEARSSRARPAPGWRTASAAEAGGSIQLSDPSDEVLMIGARLPRRAERQG